MYALANVQKRLGKVNLDTKLEEKLTTTPVSPELQSPPFGKATSTTAPFPKQNITREASRAGDYEIV